jgi:hypothetical protein
MGQIREHKQEVIDVVYNFYADLYKGQNIGLDEIKEYLTHLDLKKLDEEDWTCFSPCQYMLFKTFTKSFPIISQKRE